ncbi:Ribosomal protein S4 [Rhynchospora pubera]|uniref:Ribosomal protein S4 n=1 Tax=Rhynchospora pubera TaxID=906938 RepID=A0AAV8BNM0_9POAL|nr:ribosomal protein S4 [Rhynchospora pubera]KAJ4744708.1 Ribosomal protein S4 [Rhynchospora pubera]UYP50816.1 ribosomal protein S4 [Rhynchospora pubera]
MPSLRFKTCRLLPGNVWNRELSKIQRRILRRLRKKRKSIKRNLSLRENRNSNIKLQTTRKLSLFYGGLPRRKMHRGREQTSYIPFLLNQETRLDVILVRLHFSKTLPQARQLISHRRVFVNNGLVSITHWKVSHGDLISFPENEAKTRSEEIRRSFYIDILVGKIIGKCFPGIIWRRTKKEWFRLLKTKRGCRLLLKSCFLKELRSSMQEEDNKKIKKKFGSEKVRLGRSFAEHNRMKRHFFHLKYFLLKKRKDKKKSLFTKKRSPFVSKSLLYKKSTYCAGSPLTRKIRIKSPLTRKIRIKRIELPTHYSEVNHRTLKAVVSYGPNIGYIPHDIRLKDLNLLLWSGNGRGQNI